MKAIKPILLASGISLLYTGVLAQTGIGTFSPDPNFALHVVANGTQDPLKLEGLKLGGTETSVLVTDANGKLSYRPAADLLPSASGDNLGNHIATQNIFIQAEHQIQFNSTDKYINRFGADIDVVNLSGDAHVHAENLLITSEAIDPVAYFDGGLQRVGLGVANAPDATVHVTPVAGDFPLRIESIPIA